MQLSICQKGYLIGFIWCHFWAVGRLFKCFHFFVSALRTLLHAPVGRRSSSVHFVPAKLWYCSLRGNFKWIGFPQLLRPTFVASPNLSQSDNRPESNWKNHSPYGSYSTLGKELCHLIYNLTVTVIVPKSHRILGQKHSHIQSSHMRWA